MGSRTNLVQAGCFGVYKVPHDNAPRYLGLLIRVVDDLPERLPLCSTNINRLVVPPVKLTTVGSQAFAVAAPHVWNCLPTDVFAADSLSTFRRLLEYFFLYSGNHILTLSTDITHQWSLQ